MVTKNEIKTLIGNMDDYLRTNEKKIKETFKGLGYKDDTRQSILHIIVDDLYDEKKCFLAVKTLLAAGIDPNITDEVDYVFIQTALYAGYSEDFILKILKEAIKHGLNVNHVDSEKDTIMHTAIYSDDYLGEIINIYKLLCENNFDSKKKCGLNKNLLEAAINEKKYTKYQIEEFKKEFYKNANYSFVGINVNSNSSKVNNFSLTPEVKQQLEKFGKILNLKDYVTSPTIGREKELKNLVVSLAQDKKRPIIVGESGVGKTALADELAYRIKIGDIPSFLSNQIILEVAPSDIVAGCSYVGQFEENMKKLMDVCEKYKVILFIDEIHTIYGVGAAKDKNNDMASILKTYIDRANLKVIGTTTEKEYKQYFSEDALKRRFEKIVLKEPDEDTLYKIINKVLDDYSSKNSIYFNNEETKESIINIIISSTKKHHRVYDDPLNNPDLSVSIIDKAFAYAKVFDSEIITAQHFAQSFDSCNRLYDSVIQNAILELESFDKKEPTKKSTSSTKILTPNFKKSNE